MNPRTHSLQMASKFVSSLRRSDSNRLDTLQLFSVDCIQLNRTHRPLQGRKGGSINIYCSAQRIELNEMRRPSCHAMNLILIWTSTPLVLFLSWDYYQKLENGAPGEMARGIDPRYGNYPFSPAATLLGFVGLLCFFSWWSYLSDRPWQRSAKKRKMRSEPNGT